MLRLERAKSSGASASAGSASASPPLPSSSSSLSSPSAALDRRRSCRRASARRMCVSHMAVAGYSWGHAAHSMPSSSSARRGSCSCWSQGSPVKVARFRRRNLLCMSTNFW